MRAHLIHQACHGLHREIRIFQSRQNADDADQRGAENQDGPASEVLRPHAELSRKGCIFILHALDQEPAAPGDGRGQQRPENQVRAEISEKENACGKQGLPPVLFRRQLVGKRHKRQK